MEGNRHAIILRPKIPRDLHGHHALIVAIAIVILHDQYAYRYRTDDCIKDDGLYSHKVDFRARHLLDLRALHSERQRSLCSLLELGYKTHLVSNYHRCSYNSSRIQVARLRHRSSRLKMLRAPKVRRLHGLFFTRVYRCNVVALVCHLWRQQYRYQLQISVLKHRLSSSSLI